MVKIELDFPCAETCDKHARPFGNYSGAYVVVATRRGGGHLVLSNPQMHVSGRYSSRSFGHLLAKDALSQMRPTGWELQIQGSGLKIQDYGA